MLKYQSNIASKPATGMQGNTMTKNKHLTSLLGRWFIKEFIEPNDNRTCFGCKSYLTESVELCQWDVALTYVKISTAQI